MLEGLRTAPATPVPDLLNSTFHVVDTKLSELASSQGTHSGCTAAVVFLRLEDENGNPVGEASGVGKAVETKQGKLQGEPDGALKAAQAGEGTELQRMREKSGDGSDGAQSRQDLDGSSSLLGSGVGGSGSTSTDIKNKIKAVLSGRSGDFSTSSSAAAGTTGTDTASDSGSSSPQQSANGESGGRGVATPTVEVKGPAEYKKAAKRTLYTANVGDARAVLS